MPLSARGPACAGRAGIRGSADCIQHLALTLGVEGRGPGENTIGFTATQVGDKPTVCWWKVNAAWSCQPRNRSVKSADVLAGATEPPCAQRPHLGGGTGTR
jgi:hypothetical protein